MVGGALSLQWAAAYRRVSAALVAPAQTPDSLICPAHTHARSGASASRRRCARPQCHLSTVMQVTCPEGAGWNTYGVVGRSSVCGYGGDSVPGPHL